MSKQPLEIPGSVWKALMVELKRLGEGRRETGAFLLSRVGSRTVTECICYNELDPSAFDTGIIVFHGSGLVQLWNHCAAEGLEVVADIHTHPGSWTGQSELDRTHPMICETGHIALIVPMFAGRRNQTLKRVGIFEYLGEHRWKNWTANSGKVKVVRK